MNKITISITDDHEIVREGFVSLLNSFEDLEVIHDTSNGQELLDRLHNATLPDVILLDIDMPVLDGIETLKILRDTYGDLVKVLCLSMHEEYFIVQNLLELGANGFISKTATSDEVKNALFTVMKYDFYLSPQMSKSLFGSKFKENGGVARLTKIEEEIVVLICDQKNNKQIATELKLSPNTVNAYRTKILEKAEAINAAGLVVYAIKNGLYKV
jgi:DNA-binding NarL/FixJ family response regulator